MVFANHKSKSKMYLRERERDNSNYTVFFVNILFKDLDRKLFAKSLSFKERKLKFIDKQGLMRVLEFGDLSL